MCVVTKEERESVKGQKKKKKDCEYRDDRTACVGGRRISKRRGGSALKRERDLKNSRLDSRTETSLRERRDPSSSSSSEAIRAARRNEKNGGVRRGRGE